MKQLRSFLFVPADKQKMLGKILSLDADAFILDLEDSVNKQNKNAARENITSVLPGLKKRNKTIFIRTNEAGSREAQKDIEVTYTPLIDGYVLPKFENIGFINKFISILEKLELNEGGPKMDLIFMIESPLGIIELRKLALKGEKTLMERLRGIALGGEDYLESIAVCRQISREALDPVRDEIVIFSRSQNILAIDTVFPDFSDDEGLRRELGRIIPRGFTSKLAIHPSQLDVINRSFYPDKGDIERANTILKYKDKINEKGAISIDGVMYDAPHLKWAKKLKEYID